MGKPSVMREMPKAHRYLMQDIFLAYLAMGIYLTLIGSALPSIKAEYHISYQVGGWMMSAQQIGYLAMGIVVSLAARRLGAKCTYLFLGALAFVGLAIMMVSGNPVLLIFAMLLTGICKGSTANIGNQITSMVSNNDSSLLNLAQAFFAVGALRGTAHHDGVRHVLAHGIRHHDCGRHYLAAARRAHADWTGCVLRAGTDRKNRLGIFKAGHFLDLQCAAAVLSRI